MIRTESPIEAYFLSSIQNTCAVVHVRNATLGSLSQAAMMDVGCRHVFYDTQVEDGPYRCDFLMAAYFSPMHPRLLCVECDGREFHSRPDQRNRDADRDRYFKGKLVETMRFSGATLFRDPGRCALSAVRYVTAGRQTGDGFVSLGGAAA